MKECFVWLWYFRTWTSKSFCCSESSLVLETEGENNDEDEQNMVRVDGLIVVVVVEVIVKVMFGMTKVEGNREV